MQLSPQTGGKLTLRMPQLHEKHLKAIRTLHPETQPPH
jgi:hypothetical protein